MAVFGRPPHFHALRVPVRVELWFFVITVLMAINRTYLPFSYVFEWIAVVFVSILVHELGHAMAFRRLGQEPQVLLTGMGGLTYGSAPFRPGATTSSPASPARSPASCSSASRPGSSHQQLDVTDSRLLRVDRPRPLLGQLHLELRQPGRRSCPSTAATSSQALCGRTTARQDLDRRRPRDRSGSWSRPATATASSSS